MMLFVFALAGPIDSISAMLGHPFIRYAFVAGTPIALDAGLAGYFIVLRGQVFAGDALGHVAFTGALAALALGLDLHIGVFVLVVGIALLLGALGPRGRADDVVIGSVFAWVLGLGVLFLSFFTSAHSTQNGAAGIRVLFGSIFGLDSTQAWVSILIGVAVLAVLLTITRPLLLASLDAAVASARGVPVRGLGYLFLGLVGLVVAEATQAIGALLILGLLAAPAGAARLLTARPYVAMLLSMLIALVSVWAGLVLSYVIGTWPPSFAILVVACGLYVAAAAAAAAAVVVHPGGPGANLA